MGCGAGKPAKAADSEQQPNKDSTDTEFQGVNPSAPAKSDASTPAPAKAQESAPPTAKPDGGISGLPPVIAEGDEEEDEEEGDVVMPLGGLPPKVSRPSAAATGPFDKKDDTWKPDERVPPVKAAPPKLDNIVAEEAKIPEAREEIDNLVAPREMYNMLTAVGKEHEEMISDKSYIIIIDTRPPEEFAKSRIAFSVNLSKTPSDMEEMLGFIRVTMGGQADDEDHDEFPDFIIVYDGTGKTVPSEDDEAIVADGEVGKGVFDLLRQLEEESITPSTPSYLCGGFSEFKALYPFLTTDKEVEHIHSYPTEIITKSVYLGSWEQSRSFAVLKDLGVTHIVNCAPEAPTSFEGNSNIEYIHCGKTVRDNNDSSLKDFFAPACKFIDDAVAAKKRVLIHCAYGISRGPTIAVAYVMKKFNLTLTDGLERVRSGRNLIGPALRFLEELAEWEEELLGEKTSDPEELETLKIDVDELKFPQQVPNFSVENVFLGSAKNSMVKEMLLAQNINVIVNVAKEAKCLFEKDGDFIYFHYKLSDRNDIMFKEGLWNCIRQLDYTSQLPGARIMLHCQSDQDGKTSRSQTIMTGFIMYKEKCSLQEAHKKMKAITPHTGAEQFMYRNLFSSSLLQLEVKLLGKQESDVFWLQNSDPPIKKNQRRKTHRPTIVGRLSKMR